MYGPDPTAHEGAAGQVMLAGIDMELVPGTYVVEEAEAIPPKTATGQIQYQDLNPDDVSWEIVSLAGGYGLRRYLDIPRVYYVSQDDTRRTMYKEANGIDCRQDGAVTLALARLRNELDTTVLWVGEFTPAAGTWANVTQLVAVTEDGVWRMTDRTWRYWRRAIPLPATPAGAQAIGVFGGKLVIGYGSTRTAQYTDDLDTLHDIASTTPANLYVWVFGADHAAAFVAGGPATTDFNKITSSADGAAYSPTLTTCGSGQDRITSILPGGGIFNLIVGMENGLGALDNTSGLFNMLVPFDSNFAHNCMGARWWMGRTDDNQRGPMSILFPRQWGLWGYQPSSQNSGSAKNISPWSMLGVRPVQVRGEITALCGTADALWYVVQAADGSTYLNAQRVDSGAHHTIISLNSRDVESMTTTGLLQANNAPTLMFGEGSFVSTMDLPADGEAPADNTNVTYVLHGRLDLPDIDFDLPDELKTLYEIRVVGENLTGDRTIQVQYMLDDEVAWTNMGQVNVEGRTILPFTPGTACKKLMLRLTMATGNRAQTPILRALVVRGALNLTVRRQWTLKARIPAGSTNVLSDDLRNPYTKLHTLWGYRKAGIPVLYIDRFGEAYYVRVLHISEQETLREPDHIPESVLTLQLLEISDATRNPYVYGGEYALYGGATYQPGRMDYDVANIFGAGTYGGAVYS